MATDNKTVFQRLTHMFGYPGKTKPEEAPSYNFNKDEILKTNSKEEYEKALLQAQQSEYIADKWTKLDQSLYNQSVYYEPIECQLIMIMSLWSLLPKYRHHLTFTQKNQQHYPKKVNLSLYFPNQQELRKSLPIYLKID